MTEQYLGVIARQALGYVGHTDPRCAHPGTYGGCVCGAIDTRRQLHLALGHVLCPDCDGAGEVLVDDPPRVDSRWTPCRTCDGGWATPAG
jgi:hypothetical protein